jgi:hypothetical protein
MGERTVQCLSAVVRAGSRLRDSFARRPLIQIALLTAGIAAADQARADVECALLKQVVRESSEAGYVPVFYANEVASEPSAVNGIATRSAGPSRVRKNLESMVAMSLDAGTFAELAVDKGTIPSGAEEHFVSQVRQRTYAGLVRNHASAAWLELLVNPITKTGIVLVRPYEFPRQGLAGVMNGADQVCVRSRLEQVTLWTMETPSTLALLGGRERPDCGFASTAGVSCSGLESQLGLADSEGESVFATARTRSVLWVYTLNRGTGRGRVLHVDSNGTARLDTWLFNIDAQP